MVLGTSGLQTHPGHDHSPDLRVNVDRTRAQQIGLTQRDVASTMLISLSSSGQSAPNFWLNFQNGVNFDLDVITSDTVTAATLSSLVKAGVLYRKMTASPVEKSALEDVSVNSDSSKLQMHFKADDKQFQSLIHTSLFAAVSR